MTETIQQLIVRRAIVMRAKWVKKSEEGHDGKPWLHDEWRCTLRAGDSSWIAVKFSLGSAHQGKAPDLPDVLDCLASDAAGTEQSFEDWCADLGFDPDSRRAFQTYQACKRIADKLRYMLGDDYEPLLYEVERL